MVVEVMAIKFEELDQQYPEIFHGIDLPVANLGMHLLQTQSKWLIVA